MFHHGWLIFPSDRTWLNYLLRMFMFSYVWFARGNSAAAIFATSYFWNNFLEKLPSPMIVKVLSSPIFLVSKLYLRLWWNSICSRHVSSDKINWLSRAWQYPRLARLTAWWAVSCETDAQSAQSSIDPFVHRVSYQRRYSTADCVSDNTVVLVTLGEFSS